jgi:hypothetical protein
MTQDEKWLAKYNEIMAFMAERAEMLERLLSLWEEYKHVNQYV